MKTLMLAIAIGSTVAPAVASAAIAPGTTITGTMDAPLSSKSAQVGQTFTLSNAHSSNHDVNGATVYGHVGKVQKAGQGTAGKVELDFDKINTRSGNVYRIVGRATSVKVDTKSNAGKELGSAAGGALVGGLIGGGVGAVLGAGGGAAYAKNSRQDVTIPQGSLVTLQVSKTL
jgi:hypothetical protein